MPTSSKQVIYLVVSHGVDGRDKQRIEYASVSGKERDDWFKASKNKAWYNTVEIAADLADVWRQAYESLTPLHRLAVNYPLPGKRVLFAALCKAQITYVSFSETERDQWIAAQSSDGVESLDCIHDLESVNSGIESALSPLDLLAKSHHHTAHFGEPDDHAAPNSLLEFVGQVKIDIDRFYAAYLEQHRLNPDHYPLVLPEDNAGLWQEFFSDFCHTGGV